MIPIYIYALSGSRKSPRLVRMNQRRAGVALETWRASPRLSRVKIPRRLRLRQRRAGVASGESRASPMPWNQPPLPEPVTQVGARVDAVGLALTETVIASSRFWVMLKPVMEKSASSPVPAPSETNSAIGVLLK
mgnify:CR=1 FL=1